MTAAARRCSATNHSLFGIDYMNDTVVALGFFDGVHIGHRHILKTAAKIAKEKNCRSAACTFSVHPRAFVRGIAPAMLTTLEERKRLILEQGIERVEVLEFDKNMADMSPDDFVRLLKERYGCIAAVCGDNFRFGKNAQGNADTLRRCGIETTVCSPVDFGDEMVSSTRIRRMITEGRMQGAGALLGRNFVLTGTVVDGFKLGRRLGKPTMNLRPDDGLIVPATGVYASRVLLGGEAFFAITNIGTRPTFSNDDIVSVESHIMDFCRDIYGERAAVELVQKVRDERRFDSETELVRQIDKDMAQARLILSQEYGG